MLFGLGHVPRELKCWECCLLEGGLAFLLRLLGLVYFGGGWSEWLVGSFPSDVGVCKRSAHQLQHHINLRNKIKIIDIAITHATIGRKKHHDKETRDKFVTFTVNVE